MLRHLVGLLAGVALAPVLWIAAAWGADLLPRLADGDVTVSSVSAAVVLCLTGVGGAYLVAGRVSPLFAAAGGAPLIALALWPVAAPASMAAALDWLDPEVFLYPDGPGAAVALPLGVLLLCSAMTPTRWRATRDVPGAGRPVAGAIRDDVRRDGVDGVRGRNGGAEPDRAGPATPSVTDTIEEELPGFSSARRPPPGGGFDGDPDRTTTPFRRHGDDGAGWTPLEAESEGSGALGDDGR
ncbi:YIP1 family protein [Nocardiopsis sp. FIRDI 009]|uniref:YIP1 family protein n=1 Tax=Nocardiopsis sp. FIRDI 009 TaxID=714197 RepID=UPI000E26C8BD|nr:YIP1 family protein [Nocardiopsis sp. FIRDI 009]